MAADTPDQRRHPRLSFFLVPAQREQLPVWVFLPPDVDGLAGVILDMSVGGLKVLTEAGTPLTASRYSMRLIIGAPGQDMPVFTGTVRRIWTSELNALGHLNGMEFDDPSSEAAEFLRTAQPSIQQGKWVRCALKALED